MEKDIKKLLSKETLTGDDAGRIMILDLLLAYKNLLDGGDGSGLLSGAEKIKIVGRLTTQEDISRFNDFRGVHDFLTTVSAIYESFSKTYETYHWKLHYLLNNMNNSETENAFEKSLPIIMTKDKYNEYKLSKAQLPKGGIAVLTETENEYKAPAKPAWRELYSAESILDNYSHIVKESLDGMKDTLAECLARKKTLELVSKYIKVPRVKMLIPDIDDKKLSILNDFMRDSINSVKRDNDDYEQAIKNRLYELFTPVNLAELSPDAGAVKKAGRFLNFSVIKNESESFIASIKKEWRNDNAGRYQKK